MSFVAIQRGVSDLVEKHAGFDGKNVAYDDYEVVNSGTDKAFIFRLLDWSENYSSLDGERSANWRFECTFLYQLGIPNVDRLSMDEVREEILVAFRRFPKLGGTTGVFSAIISSGRRSPRTRDIGGVSFREELLTLEVVEEVAGIEEE